MAAPTNTLQTYAAKGIREDLTDVIWRISPTTTPFMSGIAKGKASNTLHEWQTQDLAAVTVNAQIEGDDASAIAVTATTRLSNYTQIATKTVIVSGTQQAVKTAGRNDELAYQLSLKSLELKRDMEASLCSAANGSGGAVSNATAVVGGAGTARSLRGLEGWLATNISLGASGAAPVYTSNPGTAPTDGTQRAFSETLLKTVIAACFDQGGEPDTVMVGSSNKQVFSTFTGGTTRFDKSEDKALTAAIDVYISDFGTLNVVPNRFQRARVAHVLQMDKWALAVLRPFQTTELAKTGDAEKRELIVEYTLEARQEKSSGIVRDLT